MKNLLSILFIFTCTLAFAQPTPHTVSDAQLGTQNGCNDGQTTAFYSNWQDTYYSIMTNPHISTEYKEAYDQAFFDCRGRARQGGTIETSDCTYNLYGFWITIPCGTWFDHTIVVGGGGNQ